MEDALRSEWSPFRRDEFLTFIFETRIPEDDFNVDGNFGLADATMSARCDDKSRRFQQGPRQLARKIQANDTKGESSARKGETLGDPARAVVAAKPGLSHSRCLRFLVKKWPDFLTKKLSDNEGVCSMLLEMADNVLVLPPGNAPLPWDLLDMSRWQASLCGLMKEMKTVEGNCCASLMGRSGTTVYVLTTSPYSAFLRALAMEISDSPSS